MRYELYQNLFRIVFRKITALETLAVKAFGDMGQTARLRLIRDRFIAGHSNCDLRRHLDSVSPETPIRDAVDRCRVWESHADPAVRRMSKPTQDPIYPTYAVSDTDSDNEVTRVAVVTGLKFGPESVNRHGKTVTTAGEGGTESATRGCKTASTDDTGTYVALFPRWTAQTATAAFATAALSETATAPEGLVGRDVFLLCEDGPCSDTLSGL